MSTLLEQTISTKANLIDNAIQTITAYSAAIGQGESLCGLCPLDTLDRLVNRGQRRQQIATVGIPRLERRRELLKLAERKLRTEAHPMTRFLVQTDLAMEFPSIKRLPLPQVEIQTPTLDKALTPEQRLRISRRVLAAAKNLPSEIEQTFQNIDKWGEELDPSAKEDKAIQDSLVQLWRMEGWEMARLISGGDPSLDIFAIWVTMSDIGTKKALLNLFKPDYNLFASQPPPKRGRPPKGSKEPEVTPPVKPFEVSMIDQSLPFINRGIKALNGFRKPYLTLMDVSQIFSVKTDFVEGLLNSGFFGRDSAKKGEVEVLSPVEAVAAYVAFMGDFSNADSFDPGKNHGDTRYSTHLRESIQLEMEKQTYYAIARIR